MMTLMHAGRDQKNSDMGEAPKVASLRVESALWWSRESRRHDTAVWLAEDDRSTSSRGRGIPRIEGIDDRSPDLDPDRQLPSTHNGACACLISRT